MLEFFRAKHFLKKNKGVGQLFWNRPANSSLAWVCAILVLAEGFFGLHFDFEVYYSAVNAYFSGGWTAVYDPFAETPFKYHPLTVWLFVPLGVLPLGLAAWLWAGLNGWFTYQACRRFQVVFGAANWMPVLALICVAHAWSWQIKFGNVTCLMLWLFSLFATAEFPRKQQLASIFLLLLKPFWLVLAPVYVIERAWRGLAWVIVGVLAASALVYFSGLEQGNLAYSLWEKTLSDPTNAHNYPKNDNQCLFASLYGYAQPLGGALFWIWAAMSGAYFAFVWWFSPPNLAIRAISVLPPMLFAGPLSWIHHQILLIPIFIYLLAQKRYTTVVLAALLFTGTSEALVGRDLFQVLSQWRIPVLGFWVLSYGILPLGYSKQDRAN